MVAHPNREEKKVSPRVRVGIGPLVRLLKPYSGRWLLATTALLIGGGINLALPQAVRIAVDEAVTDGNFGILKEIAVVAGVGCVLLAFFVFLRHYLMSWLGNRIVADLRDRAFRHLLRQPPGYFHARKSGELLSRLTSDIQMLQHAVGSEISIALRATITVLGGLAILFWTSPYLALVMLAIVPPVSLGAVWVRRQIRHRARKVQDLIAEANARMKEAIVGIETVQVFRGEEREAERYGSRIFAAFRTILGIAIARGSFMAGVQVSGYAVLGVILFLGSKEVIDGNMSGGSLAAFLLYTIMVSGSLMTMAGVWANVARAVGASERVFEVLGEEPSIRDAADAMALNSIEGVVVFDEVSFRYPSRPDVPVLDQVSLTVRPGEMVALVGASGAGKSTIAVLLQRFFDPLEGTVSVDGHDLRTIQLSDLRGAIATVHQEPVLFSGSIGENIAYGNQDASAEDIARVAREAYIAEFIEGLPEGYDSEVGERGVKVSGGQRQRIAIARAMLANPRILILDEATSHLDTENEGLVHSALERLMEGRTTLVIAHRLSTIRNADRIVVLDQGRIMERGTHEELEAKDGVYNRLIAAQGMVVGPNEGII